MRLIWTDFIFFWIAFWCFIFNIKLALTNSAQIFRYEKATHFFFFICVKYFHRVCDTLNAAAAVADDDDNDDNINVGWTNTDLLLLPRKCRKHDLALRVHDRCVSLCFTTFEHWPAVFFFFFFILLQDSGCWENLTRKQEPSFSSSSFFWSALTPELRMELALSCTFFLYFWEQEYLTATQTHKDDVQTAQRKLQNRSQH